MLRQEVLLESINLVQVLISSKMLLHPPVLAGFQLILENFQLVIHLSGGCLALLKLVLAGINLLTDCLQLLLLSISFFLDVIILVFDVRKSEGHLS